MPWCNTETQGNATAVGACGGVTVLRLHPVKKPRTFVRSGSNMGDSLLDHPPTSKHFCAGRCDSLTGATSPCLFPGGLGRSYTGIW